MPTLPTFTRRREFPALARGVVASVLAAAVGVVACGGGGGDGGSGGVGGGACGCAAGTAECCAVVLSPSSATTTVTLPVVAPGNELQKYTGVAIDLTAFPSGGTLVVSGKVGAGTVAVSLDLFPSATPFPTEGNPTGQLADCYNNGAGSSFTVSHTFGAPGTFKLGATGSWDAAAGTTTSVDVTLSVTSSPSTTKTCGGGGGGGGGGGSSSGGCTGCSADSDCGSCQRCVRSSCTCVARLTC